MSIEIIRRSTRDANLATTSGVKLGAWQTITGASGGTLLANTTGRVFMIQNLPSNTGNMHVGAANDPPNASKGFVLTPGSAIELRVSNENRTRVYATVSGEKIADIQEMEPF